MNKPYEIVEVNDKVENKDRVYFNGDSYDYERKRVVFGDGTGVDIYLCTGEPWEDDGRICLSAGWETPDFNKLSEEKQESLNQFFLQTGISVDVDDGEGCVRDGAYAEVVEEVRNNSREYYK